MKVLICEKVARECNQKLESAGFEIDMQTGISQDTLLEIIEEYHVLIIAEETIVDEKILVAAKNLIIIGKAGTGFENIDMKVCESRKIKVLHTPGTNSNAVAEMVIGLMIDLARSISFANKHIREDNWKFARQIGIEISGRTVAIIGLGPIGRAVADKCKALGMKVLGHTKETHRNLFDVATLVSFEEAVKNADVVVLTIPRNEETFHIISDKEIDLMKNGVILINASRRGVLDEKALLNSINNAKIRAAALDSFEENFITHLNPITDCENVILTPYLGGLTEETQKKIAIELAEKIVRTVGDN